MRIPESLVNYRKDGCTVVCIASGPSLTQEQIDVVGKHKRTRDDLLVIGVNNNWEHRSEGAFVCDYMYAADEAFWNVWLKRINEAGFDRPKFIPIKHEYAHRHGLIVLPCSHKEGLGSQESLHCGQNSGYQAINLAYFLGAKKIALIGYDMKVGPNGKVHYFGDHEKGLRNTPSRYEFWIRHFGPLAKDLKERGVDAVNCTLSTALPYFRKGDLDEELSTP